MSISALTAVHIKRVNLEKMYGLAQGTKKTVRNKEVSILSGCPTVLLNSVIWMKLHSNEGYEVCITCTKGTKHT